LKNKFIKKMIQNKTNINKKTGTKSDMKKLLENKIKKKNQLRKEFKRKQIAIKRTVIKFNIKN